MPQAPVLVLPQQEITHPLEKLVFSVARALVDDEASVTVYCRHDPDGTAIVLVVAATDLGNMIGKQGRTAKSLRSLLQAASIRLGRVFTLEIHSASA